MALVLNLGGWDPPEGSQHEDKGHKMFNREQNERKTKSDQKKLFSLCLSLCSTLKSFPESAGHKMKRRQSTRAQNFKVNSFFTKDDSVAKGFKSLKNVKTVTNRIVHER